MEPRPWVELIDHVAAWDEAGNRLPVRRDDVVALCEAGPDGVLDPDHVDRLLVAVHGEIQRLSEEFLHGARVWRLAAPLVAAVREARGSGPVRVVDLGCGTGYVVRWLASHLDAELTAPDVELVGVDLDPVLVDEAARLAAAEDLRCSFVHGDALAPAVAADVVLSTGVLHHLRGADLERLFALHEESGAAGFVHIDFQPSWLAPLGAWLFHRTRMRQPVARHDGIRSAQRAHDAALLAAVVTRHAPSFTTWRTARTVRGLGLPCALTNLVGVRHDLSDAAWARLRSGAPRLGPL